MTKPQFVDAIISDSDVDLSKAQVSAVLTAMTGVLQKEVLGNGDSITIPGLGTFKQSHRSERSGRNPKTGESISIPAKTSIKFTVSSSFGRDTTEEE